MFTAQDNARPPQEAGVPESALDWYQRGATLEGSDLAASEEAYRRAIAVDPCCQHAYANLGALLCEAGRCHEAVALYDMAICHCGRAPLLHFNRGIALEDQGRPLEAQDAYRQSLALDPAMSDAHFNLALLLQREGDVQGALRHFSAYRRLGLQVYRGREERDLE